MRSVPIRPSRHILRRQDRRPAYPGGSVSGAREESPLSLRELPGERMHHRWAHQADERSGREPVTAKPPPAVLVGERDPRLRDQHARGCPVGHDQRAFRQLRKARLVEAAKSPAVTGRSGMPPAPFHALPTWPHASSIPGRPPSTIQPRSGRSRMRKVGGSGVRGSPRRLARASARCPGSARASSSTRVSGSSNRFRLVTASNTSRGGARNTRETQIAWSYVGKNSSSSNFSAIATSPGATPARTAAPAAPILPPDRDRLRESEVPGPNGSVPLMVRASLAAARRVCR